MLFTDFLKATIFLLLGTAATLIALTVISAQASGDVVTLIVAGGWCTIATAVGLWLGGRPAETLRQLLSDAPTIPALPEIQPRTILWNRLWPLALLVLVSGVTAWFLPQIAAVASGYTVLWALSWHKHTAAVAAVERRDRVSFLVRKGSPFRKIEIVKTIQGPPQESGLLEEPSL